MMKNMIEVMSGVLCAHIFSFITQPCKCNSSVFTLAIISTFINLERLNYDYVDILMALCAVTLLLAM